MIERNMNEALVNQEPSVKSLIQILSDLDSKKSFGNSSIYHQFPLYSNETGNKMITPSILFLSQDFGIVLFECVEHSERAQVDFEKVIAGLNEIDRLIFAKILKDAPNLQSGRRDLKIKITPVIFLQNTSGAIPLIDFSQDIPILTTEPDIRKLIEENQKSKLSEEEYKDLKATIEGSKGIPKNTERNIKDKTDLKNSKGAILSAIENALYTFDIEQKRAALFTLDGAQRIRGLAGSGKTIILAMKAAQIHLQNPDAEILYTYYTKSLQDLVKRLITRFYRQFAEKDPNWNKIHIIHAWGGKGLEGVYYNACNYNGISPINLNSAKYQSGGDPFDYVCNKLIENKLRPQYDYCLMDEAQDFPVSFYRLCRQITENNRVVWAYDDFQNILDVKLQSEKETFGKDKDGNWYINFEVQSAQLQDLVLHKCYRNPRKNLIAAFSIGLGIYNEDVKTKKIKVLQRLESNEHWQSLGFNVNSGDSSAGSAMNISRPPENSFELKNEYLDNEEETIRIIQCNDIVHESQKVAQLIIEDIKKELNPEDISVVCMDNRHAKEYFSFLEKELNDKYGIKTFNLLNAPSNNTTFKVKSHVSLSTIYKAKGNEAGSVYIIGIDAIFSNKDDITERNKIFTAMTRGLAWITLTGVGESVGFCLKEISELKKNGFKLIFSQPSEQDVKTIRQDINKEQTALNQIERMAKDMNMTQEEFFSMMQSKFQNKKK